MTLTKPHTNFQKDWRPLRFHPLRCCFVLHAGIEVTGDSTEHTELSLVSLVRSGRVSTFFASTEPQESDFCIDSRNGTRQCALGPILRPEFLTLVSVVQSLSVLPFFTSTEPKKSDSHIDSHNGTRHCAIGPF